jgi:hypothetical protein
MTSEKLRENAVNGFQPEFVIVAASSDPLALWSFTFRVRLWHTFSKMGGTRGINRA